MGHGLTLLKQVQEFGVIEACSLSGCNFCARSWLLSAQAQGVTDRIFQGAR